MQEAPYVFFFVMEAVCVHLRSNLELTLMRMLYFWNRMQGKSNICPLLRRSPLGDEMGLELVKNIRRWTNMVDYIESPLGSPFHQKVTKNAR